MLWSFVLEATTNSFDDSTEGVARKLRLGPIDVCCVAQTRAAELAVGRTTLPAIVPFLSVTFASHVLVVVALPVSPRGCTALACQVGAVLTMQSVSYQRQTAFWADR